MDDASDGCGDICAGYEGSPALLGLASGAPELAGGAPGLAGGGAGLAGGGAGSGGAAAALAIDAPGLGAAADPGRCGSCPLGISACDARITRMLSFICSSAGGGCPIAPPALSPFAASPWRCAIEEPALEPFSETTSSAAS